jgi:rod shape-determining protein MreD
MAERTESRIWVMRTTYLGLCTLLIFLHLLPLDTNPRGWVGPDLILALTCAWVVRRPEFVPVPLVALVFLMSDLLFHMPPGLWAAIVVIGIQTLRARTPVLRDLAFPAEWFTVAVTLTVMALGNQIALGLLLVDRPSLSLGLMQLVMTLLFYPLVAFGSQVIFGVRKQSPGDVDALVNRR